MMGLIVDGVYDVLQCNQTACPSASSPCIEMDSLSVSFEVPTQSFIRGGFNHFNHTSYILPPGYRGSLHLIAKGEKGDSRSTISLDFKRGELPD